MTRRDAKVAYKILQEIEKLEKAEELLCNEQAHFAVVAHHGNEYSDFEIAHIQRENNSKFYFLIREIRNKLEKDLENFETHMKL